MRHFLDVILQQLQSPLISGGLVLMFTGAIVALARNTPKAIWERLRDQFMVEVDVQQTDPLFDWLTLWLNDHPYSRRARRLRASTLLTYEANVRMKRADDEEEQKRPNLILSPAKGQHFFFYRGTLLWLDRGKGDGTSSTEQNDMKLRFTPESYHLRIFGRSQEKLRSLLNESIDKAMQLQEKKISAFVANYGGWRRLRTFQPRKLDTIVLPEGVSERIISSLREFLAQREWYQEMGIPFHFGMLFHGVPGSGKTSLIAALAGELKRNLYIISLASDDMSDENLACLMNDVPPGSFMVMEDIDAALAAKVRKTDDSSQQRGLTLTGLLNTLDGFMAVDGSIVLMTTNHKDRLDPALIRPGRVDLEQEFSTATQFQLRTLYQRFFPGSNGDAEVWALQMEGKTMAEAQQDLLELRKQGDRPKQMAAKAGVLQ